MSEVEAQFAGDVSSHVRVVLYAQYLTLQVQMEAFQKAYLSRCDETIKLYERVADLQSSLDEARAELAMARSEYLEGGV